MINFIRTNDKIDGFELGNYFLPFVSDWSIGLETVDSGLTLDEVRELLNANLGTDCTQYYAKPGDDFTYTLYTTGFYSSPGKLSSIMYGYLEAMRKYRV